MKIRIKFAKYGAVKFIGHLDVMRYFQKAIRRAGIDVAYSEGYSPHQIMSFAAPLSVGHTSEGEYFDIEVNSFEGIEDLVNRLQAVMVEGIDILDAKLLEKKEKNAMASVAAASYLVFFRDESILPEKWQDGLAAYYGQDVIPVVKQTKKGEKQINLKESIYDLQICQNRSYSREHSRLYGNICEGLARMPETEVYLLLNASSGGNIKPSFVLDSFFRTISFELPPFALIVHRLETYQNFGTEEERRLVPLLWEK